MPVTLLGVVHGRRDDGSLLLAIMAMLQIIRAVEAIGAVVLEATSISVAGSTAQP